MSRETNNGWKAKVGKKRKNSEFDGVSRSLGVIPASSTKARTNSFGVSRTNCHESNIITVNFGEGTLGGIARQLIEAAEKQLAYHKTQAIELESRLQELRQFTERLEKRDKESA